MPEPLQKVRLDPSCVWSPDMAAQVAAALRGAPKSRMEHAGVLYQNPAGEYCYSTLAEGTADNFRMSAMRSEGNKLAGTFHTHHAASDRADRVLADKFSKEDIEMADKLNMPSFIQTPRSLRKYVPGMRDKEYGEAIAKVLKE